MPTHIDILKARLILGRDRWQRPTEHGPDGWRMLSITGRASVVISCAEFDGVEWIHASMTGPDRVPTYDEMRLLHRAVWGDGGYAYEIHAPKTQHVNIHEHALHLWGRRDGRPVLPEFGALGTI